MGYPENYRQARDAFRRAVANAGGNGRVHEHPTALGPDDAPLSIDVGEFGDPQSPAVLLSISGTHGLEGFAGSAAQTAFVETLNVPAQTRVLLVHALNPYGMAWVSRSNEDNVDLSRNFLRFEEGLPENPWYERVHSFYAVDNWPGNGEAQLRAGFERLMREVGAANALTGITGGQYTHADGINFGGSAPAWSRRVLEAVCAARLSQVERLAYVDFHTGFGAWSEPFFVCVHAPGSAEHARLEQWWGPINRNEDAFGVGATPVWRGVLSQGLSGWMLPRAQIVGAVVEFGTYSATEVGEALMIDRWLRFGRVPDAAQAAALRVRMAERFNPAAAVWRETVTRVGASLQARALTGLSRWQTAR